MGTLPDCYAENWRCNVSRECQRGCGYYMHCVYATRILGGKT